MKKVKDLLKKLPKEVEYLGLLLPGYSTLNDKGFLEITKGVEKCS